MAVKALQLRILTPERVVYDSQVDSVSVTTSSGAITVLPNHIPLVSELGLGSIKITKDGEEILLANTGGVIEVRENGEVVILGNTTEHAHEINLEEAEKAYQRAKEAMNRKEALEDVDYARFKGLLDQNLNRLNIARRLK